MLTLDNIGRRKPRSEQWLLRDVSLEVRPGDSLAITGPSGSGKSLLLRSAAQLDPIDAGRVLWQDEPVADGLIPRFRASVAYLHQRPSLPIGSARAALRQPFRLHAHRHATYDEPRVCDMLERLGRSASLLGRETGKLSGGESQLIALVRAMQLDYCVLLLDEPTASLDEQATHAVERLVSAWLAEGSEARAAVWVSHDSRQAARVARRRLTMDGGQLQPEA